jgi:hypothetical protein
MAVLTNNTINSRLIPMIPKSRLTSALAKLRPQLLKVGMLQLLV